MTKEKRARIRAVKKDSHASQLLKVLRATGLFRWEKPSTHAEEVVNILTHGIGIGLAVAALTLLVVFAGLKGDPWAIVSCAIFGVTMITLYFGSTMCHATIGKKHECFFEVWDSVAIYALIAGTYTPFLLVNLRGIVGWVVFGILWAIVSCAIFGVTMITLYFGSTMCHATIGKKHECFFEVWDSVAIYALIAGTYTPFLLVNLRGIVGWVVFGILWAIVLFGSYMKIRNPKQQPRWMVALYVAMGWTLLFILPAMIANIPVRGMWFILAGGLSYTIGVIFYLWRRMKFSHAVWHLFVIGGSVCFFFAVLFGCILDK